METIKLSDDEWELFQRMDRIDMGMFISEHAEFGLEAAMILLTRDMRPVLMKQPIKMEVK